MFHGQTVDRASRQNARRARQSEKAGFHAFSGPSGEYGSFEVFWIKENDPDWIELAGVIDGYGEPLPAGWYWQACFPGCLPDGEPTGPFNTSTEAWDDAQSD